MDQSSLNNSHCGIESLGKVEKKPRPLNFEPRVCQQAAGLGRPEQNSIGIDRRAAHDQPRGRIERVMLHDAESASRAKYAPHLASKAQPVSNRHVMIHANGRDEVEPAIFERNTAGVILHARLDSSNRGQHSGRRIAPRHGGKITQKQRSEFTFPTTEIQIPQPASVSPLLNEIVADQIALAAMKKIRLNPEESVANRIVKQLFVGLGELIKFGTVRAVFSIKQSHFINVQYDES